MPGHQRGKVVGQEIGRDRDAALGSDVTDPDADELEGGADPGGERVDVVDAGHGGVPRDRGAQRLQLAAHHQLVLGVHQGLRRRSDRHALGDQGVEHRGRHVLVVERQCVGARRRPAQGVEVGVLADHHIGGDLGGGIVGADGEDSQALAEGDRRLVGHPGQLSAANHGDDRRSGGSGGVRHGNHRVLTVSCSFTGGDLRDYADLQRLP